MADVPLPERSCTCHPDDNPPVPCPKKYSLRECVTAHAAAVTAAKDARIKVLEDALRLALAELDELPAWSNAGYVCNIARAALEQTGHNARLTCPQGREEKA